MELHNKRIWLKLNDNEKKIYKNVKFNKNILKIFKKRSRIKEN